MWTLSLTSIRTHGKHLPVHCTYAPNQKYNRYSSIKYITVSSFLRYFKSAHISLAINAEQTRIGALMASRFRENEGRVNDNYCIKQ